jgi:hypothetical protein
MTILDNTTPAADPTFAGVDVRCLQPVSFDLYRDVHKAIRVEMFAVVTNIGRLDVSDHFGCLDVADQVESLVNLLRRHAEHEDGSIQSPLEQASPELAARVANEHEALEHQMDHLVALAMLLRGAPNESARAVAHELYLDLAAFTGDYLAHQDVEERVIGPVLDEALGVQGLLGLHGAIMASIPPQEQAHSLALMFPAMNIDDRTELLGGMRVMAPAEVFAGTWSLARSVLSAHEAQALAARLGLGE